MTRSASHTTLTDAAGRAGRAGTPVGCVRNRLLHPVRPVGSVRSADLTRRRARGPGVLGRSSSGAISLAGRAMVSGKRFACACAEQDAPQAVRPGVVRLPRSGTKRHARIPDLPGKTKFGTFAPARHTSMGLFDNAPRCVTVSPPSKGGRVRCAAASRLSPGHS
jgi:hypothetical protein